MSAPTIEQAQAICAIRDRLWQYTRKSFRRFNKPRDAEALLLHLADLHERLLPAEAEAARIIPPDEIERRCQRTKELNAEIYARRAKYLEPGYQHFRTDAQSIREEMARMTAGAIERLQRDMEPDEAASLPLYESQYQPRYWARLCAAGLVHDGIIRDPAEAARFFEAKPKREADEIPATLEGIIEKEQSIWKSIRENYPVAQDAEKHPSIVKLRRAAWRAAPAAAREKVESYLGHFRGKNWSIATRFALLADYVAEGAEAFEERIKKAVAERDEYHEAMLRLQREAEEKHRARIAEIEARRAMSPEQREADRQERRRKRFAKQAQMIEQASKKGFVPTSKRACLFCGRGLHDPVSAVYGVGPDCREVLVEAIGETAALQLLETLKAERSKEGSK
jgi:hypothetical protein